MKTAGRIYRWIIISVVFQMLTLLFLNNIFLAAKSEVTATINEVTGETLPKIEDVSLKIPSDASDFKVSFDGSYAGYMLDDRIVIVDLRRKKEIKRLDSGLGPVKYYRWLPDRNMLIYSISVNDSKSGRVMIYTYDVEMDLERDPLKISDVPKDSKVVDIELSPMTNVVYLKVDTGKSRAAIYKFNVMNNLSYIMSTDVNTVIKETTYSDKLVYCDTKNRLYVRDGIKNVTWPFPFRNKMELIGIDWEDKVYVGELNEAKEVTKIYYGKLAVEPDKAWTQMILKKPAPPSDIFITLNGTVYGLSEAESALYNLQSNKKITYKGKFAEVLDDYVVTLENNEIRLAVITDDTSVKN